MRANSSTGWLATVIVAAIAMSSCDVNLIGKKEVNEDTIRDFYDQGGTFVVLEAAQRLLSAIDGNTVPGVTLVPVGNRVDATVGMDVDGLPGMETEVRGNVQFPNENRSFDDGATVSITGVTGSSVDGSLSAVATTTGVGTVTVDGGGEFEGDSGVPVNLDLNLTVAPATGLVLGTVDIDAGDLSATAFYEDNGFGGFQVRVVGNDFEFTVGGY